MGEPALACLVDALERFLASHLPADWWPANGLARPVREAGGSLEELGRELLELLREWLADVPPKSPLRSVLSNSLGAKGGERARASLRRAQASVLEWTCGAVAAGIPAALAGYDLAREPAETITAVARATAVLRRVEARRRPPPERRPADAPPFVWRGVEHLFAPAQARLLDSLRLMEPVPAVEAARRVWGEPLPPKWKTNLRKLQSDTNAALARKTIPVEVRRPPGRTEHIQLLPV
jgi:hypothetical protein